jgi:hypothetical protein
MIRAFLWVALATAALQVACAQNHQKGGPAVSEPTTTVMVKSWTKPGQPIKEYPTRLLELLPGFTPRAVPLSIYGGRADITWDAAGFVRVRHQGKRWWLVDPEGHPLLHVGVVSVSPGGNSQTAKAALAEKYGSAENWARAAAQLLRDHGFNGVGAWSDWARLRSTEPHLLYTCIWNFMSGFGKTLKITHQQPGHTGYAGDCIPVFHPGFEGYCRQRAQELAPLKDDPWLVGHFSDNEMPCPKDLLDRHLKLDANDPNLKYGYEAAKAWLAQRGKGPEDITDQDREAFRGYVFGRYYEITTKAIREADPNHLCLGSRLHGSEKGSAAVFAAAGKWLDVVSVNYYGVWTPSQETLRQWATWSGKPVIITEWYTKGDDVGYKNTSGAGWIVPTQEDRGKFYQNYVLALLQSGNCVGWHWFKYMDNDPEDLTTDPSNRDSNKGIVSIRFEPYTPLLNRMKALNEQVYALVDYFDAGVH